MARDLPLGNGNLLINFDDKYNIRDIYYPHVGQENHALDHLSHFGVWSGEGFFWIDDPGVVKQGGYAEDTLVTRIGIRHERLGLNLKIQDTVDVHKNMFLRKVAVGNELGRERTVRLYFHLDLHLYGTPVGDTVYYDPDLRSLVFFKGHRYMSLSCMAAGDPVPGPSSYAAGHKEIHGLEGTWRDAEDGKLEKHPIAQGSVDGTIELELRVPAGGSAEGWFWAGFGKHIDEIRDLEGEVRDAHPQAWMDRTDAFWRDWVARDRHELELLEPDMAAFYKRCLLIVRTNMDNGGAIVAANDSDILKLAKDTYSYMWPRDGALIAHALDRAGYPELTRRFFDFCKRTLSSEHYMMHKYNPDGSVGSSWHPWVNLMGFKQFAIQEDETALVLYALWHHHELAGTLGESSDDYESFVLPAADFMQAYRGATGLPLPSYDLWEERYGVLAFTVSTVYAGMLAACRFAEYHGDHARAENYRDTAERIREAARKHLYSEEEGRYIRALYWNPDKETFDPDMTLDASMYGLFDFGIDDPADPRMVRTMERMKEKLWVNTKVGGMARYENDYYWQVTDDIGQVPGNPWYICTLWYAEWLVAKAGTLAELGEARDIIRWAMDHALLSGVMAEQVHPFTGDQLSAGPLTWSHASFIKVTQEYLAKLKEITGTRKEAEDQGESRFPGMSAEHLPAAGSTGNRHDGSA